VSLKEILVVSNTQPWFEKLFAMTAAPVNGTVQVQLFDGVVPANMVLVNVYISGVGFARQVTTNTAGTATF